MSSRLESLRQALSLSPDNAPLLLIFAQACLEEWALDDARQAFDKLLALEPANPEAMLGIARVLHLAGRTSEAAVRLEALLAKHPRHAPALVLLARVELIEGAKDSAREHYANALQIDPLVKDSALESELYSGGVKPDAPHEEPEKVRMGASGWSSEADDDSGATTDSGSAAELETPILNFADVGGMEPLKEEIRMKIIHPLKNPELFRAYGKKIGGGVLLYGPPGCGKTLLARATAGEIKASFISIGIHQILNLYLGESEKNLHDIFDAARRNAPTVLFFDEVDALAADRNDLKRSAGRTLINQFLAEMDGNLGDNEGLLILGATNAPWHLDPAFRRPGRFDRILFVPPPDETARRAIIEVLARGKPVTALDAAKLAARTKDFSGADLKAMFDLTIERIMAKAMKEGRVLPVATADLLASAKQLRPSTRAWFESARNYALYANQGGFYDDILEHLGIKK